MKIIPVYLPQFHTIPENDEWWGKGFTEWINVKNAKPLFEGHNQPRVPLNDNYYDLSDVDTLKWQCKIAKEHGIYGFCMYHYWFNGHLLLEKPIEMLLAHPEIDIKYCISWANHDWTDSWKATNNRPKLLIGHNFDDEEDWVRHFNYMLPFFKDTRYISEKNKPFMIVYVPNLIGKLNKMLDLWNSMAQKNGFAGLTFIYQSAFCCFDTHWDRSRFDYGIHFQPGYITGLSQSKQSEKISFMLKYCPRFLDLLRKIKDYNTKKDVGRHWNYDEIWNKILELHPNEYNIIPSAFVDWDNTPRRKSKGTLIKDASPEKFEIYFKQLVKNARQYYHQDKLFVFAWNEWAEGGYLEPDTRHEYGYLKAIFNTLKELNELEQ